MPATVAFATKVLVPRRRSPGLHRARLFDLLFRALDHRIITLIAPAGYGKTTVLAEFSQAAEMPVCWYALDASDDDPRVFLGYVIAAIQRRFPAWGTRTADLLREADSSTSDITRVVGALVSDVLEEISDRFLLVLDDVHVLEDQPAVLHALNLLVQHLPENAHLCLAGRSLPDLPALPRLVAGREVARLRAPALAFTDDEVRAVLHEVYHLDLDEDQIAAVIARCEGWAAGIALAALALEDGRTLDGPSAGASPTEVFQYLSEEVLARQPEHLQRFLVSCSVLADDLRPDVCAAVLGVPEAAAWLADTEERGLFISSLEGGRAYRFHGLFGEFLQDQLQRQPEAWADLQSRAGKYFAAQRAWPAAVRHFQASGDSAALAATLTDAAPELYDRGDGRTLASWMDALPRPELLASRALTLWRAKVAIVLGQIDTALPLADRVLDETGHADPADEIQVIDRAEAKTVRAGALRAKNQLDEALDLSGEAARSLTPYTGRRAALVTAEAQRYIGAIAGQRGQYEAAIAALKEALTRYEAHGVHVALAVINNHLGAACRSLGRFDEALAYFERARDLGLALNNPGAQASVLNNLGNLYVSMHEYAAASDVLEQALVLADAALTPRVSAFAAATLGDAARAQGQWDAALSAYRRAADAAKAASERGLHSYIVGSQGLIYLHLGESSKASQLTLAACELGGGRPGTHYQAYLDFVRGVLSTREGHAEDALPLLTNAITTWRETGNREYLARAVFHQAAALYGLGERGAMESLLEEAAHICSDLRHELLLLPEAHLASGLVEFSAGRGIGDGLYARLWRELPLFSEGVAGTGDTPIVRTPVAGAPAERPSIRAFALGRAEVFVGQEPVKDAKWVTQKTRELFYFLLSHPSWVHRNEIIAALWPDYSEARGSSVLRTTAYRLRKAMYDECLIRENSYFRLDPGGQFWLDAAEFERLVQEVQTTDLSETDRRERLEQAVQLYRGDFLKGLDGEWCENTRVRLESYYLTAVMSLADEQFARNQYADAARAAQLALEADPYHEDALALLLESLVFNGERMAALEQYRLFADRLKGDLDEEPSPRLQRLARRIRSLQTTAPDTSPALGR